METSKIDIVKLKEALSRIEQNSSAPPDSPPPVLRGLWYRNRVIKLDGWYFEGCRFDGCKLVVSSPYFALNECFIDGSNTIVLEGELNNIVKLVNFEKATFGSKSAYIPNKNFDGTITIGA